MADKNGLLIALASSKIAKIGTEFRTQPFPQKVFTAIWQVEAEVNNGGFSQYFVNSSSETAWFVVEALETIGAPKTADICKRAINAAFPEGLPSNPEQIRAAAADFPDEIEDELSELDQEFYTYPHNLTALLFAFVRKHPEEFGTLPKADDE